MNARGMMMIVVGLLPSAVACSGTVEPESDGEASDVRVAQCPASVEMHFGKRAVYTSTPTKGATGATLSASQREGVKAIMDATRAAGTLDTSMRLDRTASGRCYYRGSAPGEMATFRTTKGTNLFQVFGPNGLQIFAFPKSYDRSGLKFATSSKASLFANVGLSGPFSDGGSVSVKIGSVAIGAPASTTLLTLKAGDNDRVEDGPKEITLVAKASGVEATVVRSDLATCTVAKIGDSASETKFLVKLDYEIDDGFNGCALSFANGSGYRSNIDVGWVVGD